MNDPPVPMDQAFDVRSLDSIRVTAWSTFDKCPQRWAASRFGIVGPSDNKYTRIGTAVHAVIEAYLRWQFELSQFDRSVRYLTHHGVSDDEQENLREYLETLSDVRPRVFAIEHEFYLQAPGIDVPIPGHMDVVYQEEDRSLVIRDHKTNRRYKSADWWSQQDQPRMYSWGARQQWPGYDIHYEIGYVNLNRVARWTTSRADDLAMSEVLQRRWRNMVACSDMRAFPEVFNDDCGFCPLRSGCRTYNAEMNAFLDQFLSGSLNKMSIIDRLQYLERIRKVADDEIGELERELAVRALAEGGRAVVDGRLVSLEYSSRRAVDAWELIQATQREGFPQLTTEEFVSLFTAKVGGVDKLLKRYPHLEDRLLPMIADRPSRTPRLVVGPAQDAGPVAQNATGNVDATRET